MHAVLPLFGLPLAGFQRGVGEKLRQLVGRVFVVIGRKIARRADQFLQVFHARFAAFAAVFFKVREQAAAREHFFGGVGEVHSGGGRGHFVNQLPELLQRAGGARR